MPALPWLVLDMDEGVIRRESTRAALVAWLLAEENGVVLRRRDQGPGAYEYTIGLPGEDSTSNYFVERLDAAVCNGWDWYFQVPDKFPFADRPHDQDFAVDRDALIAALHQCDDPAV